MSRAEEIARQKLIVNTISSNNHHDYVLKLFQDGGYVLLNSLPRPKYYIFGPIVHEMTFLFNPSQKKIREWIAGFIETEQYENIRLWERILAEKRALGLK